jgi:hypothetical protein
LDEAEVRAEDSVEAEVGVWFDIELADTELSIERPNRGLCCWRSKAGKGKAGAGGAEVGGS